MVDDDLTKAHREIALLKQAMTHRDERIEELKEAIEKLSSQVADVAHTLSEAKGGWRMVILLGGTAGASLSWALSHLTLRS
jgi:chromosome segregation ATPase